MNTRVMTRSKLDFRIVDGTDQEAIVEYEVEYSNEPI